MVTSAEDLDKCSRFIEEVRGVWFNKVKERQVSKFSNLLVKSRNALDNNRSAINNIRQVYNTTILDRTRNNNNRDSITNSKWVINLTKDNLTQAQVSVLAKGPNFSLASINIPNMDYITAVESMCSRLKEEDAMVIKNRHKCIVKEGKGTQTKSY